MNGPYREAGDPHEEVNEDSFEDRKAKQPVEPIETLSPPEQEFWQRIYISVAATQAVPEVGPLSRIRARNAADYGIFLLRRRCLPPK